MTEPEVADIGKPKFLSDIKILAVLRYMSCNFKWNLMEGSFDRDLY
jgi:hypothetical protein